MSETGRAAQGDLASRPVDPRTDEAIAEVEEQFTILFNRVSAGMRDRAARVHPDLQPVGFKLLSTLVRTGPVHAGALAGMLLTDKSVVSRQVRILEELGFVDRQTDPSDRRASFLVATPAAIEKVNEARAADQAQLYRNLRQWGAPDVERLGELLARLNDLV
ncbi:MarR family transcriptional regulator [Leifsonia sp. NPDC080035]|uniref:MarR family transcriptional regulator n=1 Tax=Leifsonia sp. NPDC080035 TaxID=3143936 RepID=A0AAU7GH68_9MICO